MRISDWSSDVCSSDLHLGACIWRSRDDQESPPLTRWNLSPQVGRRGHVHGAAVTPPERPGLRLVRPQGRNHALQHGCQDRKNVVSGKSVSVRVDLGSTHIIKKKKSTRTRQHNLTKKKE